jgi:hypothetical protein
MVPENVRAGLTCDGFGVFGGTSKFGFLILSCRFKLGSHDWDCSAFFHFPSDGVGGHCHRHPTFKLPIVGSVSFFGAEPKKAYWFNYPSF